MQLERLQKIIAHAGFASRREAEAMIREGRVTVNGKVVTELGTRADAAADHVKVDGKLITRAENRTSHLQTEEDDDGRRPQGRARHVSCAVCASASTRLRLEYHPKARASHEDGTSHSGARRARSVRRSRQSARRPRRALIRTRARLTSAGKLTLPTVSG